MRNASIQRKTNETNIDLSINLDGKGLNNINTGIGFLNHMLKAFSKHSNIDLNINANGDLDIDSHHLIEDIGICLGKAINDALNNKKGIIRFSNAFIPMDEALTQTSIDISGRGYLIFNVDLPKINLGNFEVESLKEFFYAFAINSKITLHINVLYGENTHHIIESIFKSFAVSLKNAIKISDNPNNIPSTKGIIEK